MPAAPNPSVETLFHAFLPHKFIDHTHANAILALTDQPDGEELCREVFDGQMVLVPYVMPGFALAKLAAELASKSPKAEGHDAAEARHLHLGRRRAARPTTA